MSDLQAKETEKDEMTEHAKEFAFLAHAVIERCWQDLYAEATSPSSFTDSELVAYIQSTYCVLAFAGVYPVIVAGQGDLNDLKEPGQVTTAVFRCDSVEDWRILIDAVQICHGYDLIERALIQVRSLDCWSES